MKCNPLKLSLIGFLFTSITGVLLHFVYDWSGENAIIGLFGAVNESTWEHMKLLFFPVFIFTIFEYFICKEQDAFWANAIGVFFGLLSIPTLFYTYTGMIGKNIAWVDILIFFISVFITYYVSYKILISENNKKNIVNQKRMIFIGMVFFAVMTILFFYFSYNPPAIPLFQSPV